MGAFKVIGLGLLVVALAAGTARGDCSFECPDSDGFFGLVSSCSQYVKCVDGEALLQSCPSGLKYDVSTGICSENVQCSSSASDSCELVRVAATDDSAIFSDVDCSCGKCCRIQNPYSCNSYFECDADGVAQLKSCDEGLVYNPDSDNCDLPANYECPINSGCGCKCRYPVEGECDSYYYCEEIGGEPVKRQCSEGLEFNAEKEQCAFPGEDECPAPTPTPVTTPEECVDLKADCKYWAANGDCECDPFRSGDCSWQTYVKRSCPASCSSSCDETAQTTPEYELPGGCSLDCKLGEYLRHPTDCEQYIQCTPYGPQAMPCGEDTRWDQELLTCNWKSSTPCVTGNYVDADGNDCTDVPDVATSAPRTTAAVQPPADVTTSASTGPTGSIDGCIIDCSKGQYWPHPTDCAKFIQCAPYGPQEMPCAPGTRWNQDILTCDWESSTPCVTGSYVDADGNKCGSSGETPGVETTGAPVVVTTEAPAEETTEAPAVETTEAPAAETTEAPAAETTEAPAEETTEAPAEETTEAPAAETTEAPVEETTEAPAEETTEAPAEETTEAPAEETTEAPAEETTEAPAVETTEAPVAETTQAPVVVTTEAPVVVTSDSCDLVCPQTNGEFPHPSECSKWVRCSDSVAYIKDCPADLLFNPVLRVCDFPDNAGCTSVAASTNSSCGLEQPAEPTNEPMTEPDVCDCDCCLRPHPDDCQSYYYCDGDQSEFFTCAEGLVFDPELETCVFAADYPECQPDVPPTCECECLYPSTVCSQYFQCVDDTPEKKECPTGLYFNDDTHSCDLPQNVECDQGPQSLMALPPQILVKPIQRDQCSWLPDGRYASSSSQEFYLCANNRGFLSRCQLDTVYSSRERRCVKK